MFVGLIQRCEQIAMPTRTLSQATDVFDERFYALPNLIDALSAIIIEMTVVSERGDVETIPFSDRLDRRGIFGSARTSDGDDDRLLSALSTETSASDVFIGDQNDLSAANETRDLQTVSRSHR